MSLSGVFSLMLWKAFSISQAGGFFAKNIDEIKRMFEAQLILKALLNPLILIVVGILLIYGILTKRKNLLLFLFGVYGYSTVHFYSLAKIDKVGFDMDNLHASGFSNMLIFIGGVFAVTAVILYFTFLKSD